MHPDLDLLHQPVPQLLRRLAIPAGTGFIFTTLFNVVDTFYGGLISTQALAAMGLSFPVFFLLIAVSGGISTGATALTGHALGSHDRESARLYAAQTLSFALIHGVGLAVAGTLAAPALFSLLGAEGEYLALAVGYMGIIFAGAPFFAVNHGINSILNASGDTRSFRNFLITGFFCNLVLDPLFLFGGLGIPPMGLAGIALATVLVHSGGTFYLLQRARRTGLLDRQSLAMLSPRSGPYRDLFRQGMPASLSMLTVSLGIFVITWYLGRFGQTAVAAYGIGARIEQAAILPIMGLNIATLTLVAQNSGACHFGRVRQTVQSALRMGLILTLVAGLASFFGAPHLASIFTSDPEVMAITAAFLRFSACTLPAYLILYICTFALQGMRRPLFAVLIGSYRQILAPVPVFWLLAVHAGFGIRGIWWGILVVTWSAALLALLYMKRTLAGLAADRGDPSAAPPPGIHR